MGVCACAITCASCACTCESSRTRESETSDVTVTLRERVRIRHVGMFRIVVDSSHPNTPHNTTHASNESLASTRGKSNSTRAIVATQETARDRSWGQPAQVPHTCLAHKVLSKMQVSPRTRRHEEYSLDLGSSSCSIGSQDFPYAMGRLRVIATRNSAHGCL